MTANQLTPAAQYLRMSTEHQQYSPIPAPQPEAAKNSDPELRRIVTDLIAMLNAKNILNDSEGMALLRKLSK